MTRRTRSISRFLNVAATLILTSLLLAGAANAAGFGGYLGLDYTEGDVDVFGLTVDHERSAVDLGFVMDTNLSRDRLFNYRLRLGMQAGKREYDIAGFGTVKEKTIGFAITNTFGFGIVRTPAVRLWIGPSIRFAVDDCTDCSGYDSVFLAIGGGPEIGLNYNVGRHLTIGPSLSYNYMFGVNIEDDEDFDGPQHQVSLLVNVFFRTESDSF